MATLRDIRTRIASVKNTRQITNAMKMVSAAKLRRATEAATSARPYQRMLTSTLQRVAASAGEVEEPLLQQRPDANKILLVIIGTDRGLCGGFNNNLNRRADEWIRKIKGEGKTVDVLTYGKKPRDFLRQRGANIVDARIENNAPKYVGASTALGAELAAKFVSGEYDEVWLGYNWFKSTMTQVPTFLKVLPVALESTDVAAASTHPSAAAAGPEFKYEPSGPEILGALLPLYLRTLFLQSFLETEAGEHAARMAAMDSATRNANDLIKALTLDYNRGRQAAITKELIEIVSGAEAL